MEIKRHLLKDYAPKQAWIINRSLRQTIIIGDTQVNFMPWYDLLGDDFSF